MIHLNSNLTVAKLRRLLKDTCEILTDHYMSIQSYQTKLEMPRNP